MVSDKLASICFGFVVIFLIEFRLPSAVLIRLKVSAAIATNRRKYPNGSFRLIAKIPHWKLINPSDSMINSINIEIEAAITAFPEMSRKGA
jgi:hypothetical protein